MGDFEPAGLHSLVGILALAEAQVEEVDKQYRFVVDLHCTGEVALREVVAQGIEPGVVAQDKGQLVVQLGAVHSGQVKLQVG